MTSESRQVGNVDVSGSYARLRLWVNKHLCLCRLSRLIAVADDDDSIGLLTNWRLLI